MIASPQKRKKRHRYRFPQHEVGARLLHRAAANVSTEQTKGRRAEGGVKGQREKNKKRKEVRASRTRLKNIPGHSTA